MKISRLPEGGSNLFQAIKAMIAEAERRGISITKLTIGQPFGPALETARRYAAEAVLLGLESMHEYQDNGSPGVPDFARRFVGQHQKDPLVDGLSYLPIPGIKPMLGLIPMACGGIAHTPEWYKGVLVATMTDPGYPTPAVWCNYLGIRNKALAINPQNAFRFNPESIPHGTTLLMLNYPHNPTGQVADEAFWKKICDYCQKMNIRVFNDAAYAILAYPGSDASTLAAVAQNYPDLSWAEAYSASKVIGNGTGWRIGAMVGSPDFIGDISTIKGNTDSGFFAPAAHGVIKCMEEDMGSILECRNIYLYRNNLLCNLLMSGGMRIAVKPDAGFFSLWLVPKKAFGQEVRGGEEFNHLMIEKTGVAGVHFGNYIRYAVTSPIDSLETQHIIAEAFKEAQVQY